MPAKINGWTLATSAFDISMIFVHHQEKSMKLLHPSSARCQHISEAAGMYRFDRTLNNMIFLESSERDQCNSPP